MELLLPQDKHISPFLSFLEEIKVSWIEIKKWRLLSMIIKIMVKTVLYLPFKQDNPRPVVTLSDFNLIVVWARFMLKAKEENVTFLFTYD